jgi:Sigma-70 region 2
VTEDPFVAHRSLLFTVAYEMLGSAADAEDVLQESWLRWADVVLIADGGGLAAAALAPIHGAELVARLLHARTGPRWKRRSSGLTARPRAGSRSAASWPR